ncbi:hypothetical protein ACFYVR_24130 [Rhodococcus sp. NPDC003318]|uniref:hypothetical protein n=1 Tax=Rhodococcus sp. NPDC003318 TaxID=3364503 RepID=UPI0036A6B33C
MNTSTDPAPTAPEPQSTSAPHLPAAGTGISTAEIKARIEAMFDDDPDPTREGAT